MPYRELDTARIYYERAGSGDPAVVLVHGYTCAHDDWSRQVAHFAPRHTVVTCDLRAHGKSSGDAQDCTIETYGRDVAAVMNALHLSPAVLVGHSMGCRVVLEAYRQAPARVAGLVLIDGSLLGTDPQAADAMRSHIAATGGEAFARALFSEALLPATAEAEQIMQRAVRFPEAVTLRLFPAMIEWEARTMADALASVRVPLLAIQSTYLNAERKRTRLAPGQSSPWLDLVRSLVPDARIEIVPAAGHFTMIDAPDACNRLLAEFAAGVS
jgi:pimeloyl-ACP methyl ester carboxylesterase